MDNVDFHSSARTGRAWMPIRDAVALVLKPFQARLSAPAGGPPLLGEPRLDTAPEGWMPPEYEYCERLMAELRQSAAQPAPALPEPEPEPEVETDAESMAEIVDISALFAAVRETAIEDPATVAEARALLADPEAAVGKPEIERQVSWLVALADLEHRRAEAARIGGAVA